MNSKSTPKAQERFAQPFVSNLNIKGYDTDNLYPNKLLLKLKDSSTAGTCLERYIDFLEGNGLHSPVLAATVINRDGQTLDKIHALVCADKATFDGFALLVQYDIYCRPCAIYHVPFEQCRLEETDADGNVAHIVVHPDWTGMSTRDGSRIAVNEDNITRIDVFNPEPTVVAEQIRKAGGITEYKGQIYYHSGAGHLVYPTPRYDSAITDISTDTGISNVMHRNVRNNFMAAGMLTYYSNLAEGEDDDIAEQMQELQGDTNACKIIAMAIQNPEEKPEFTEFSGHNFDKDFTSTADAVTERIYSRFGQEGWYCLRIGRIGFSGDLVKDIEVEYSKRVRKQQRVMTEAYVAILSRFAEGTLAEEPTIEALSIEPYSSIETHNTTEI